MRLTAIALVVSLFTLSAGNAFAQEAPAWRKVADAIPLGSKVKLQTLEGKRVSGTLMRVDDTAVVVKKNTRMPDAAVTRPQRPPDRAQAKLGAAAFVRYGKAVAA